MFEVTFSREPPSTSTTARRALSPDVTNMMNAQGGKVVLDPEKSFDFIRSAIVLETSPASEGSGGQMPAEGEMALIRQPGGGVGGIGGTVGIGPQIGVEPCIYVTVGFIWPCGKMRIGGCS